LIFLGIGLIHGIFINSSLNIFFSWILVGLWILFTRKFIHKIKEYNEYNSQKNTSFFLIGTLGVGLFYNLWGYFTGLWGENLLEEFIPSVYVSLWTLIFAFPYLIYGLYTIRACFTKFNIVYLIRTRSLNARKFGIFYTILILFGILSYVIFFNIILNYFYIIVEQVYFYFDLMLVFIFLFLSYIFIRHGIFGSARSMPEISQDYIARRRQRLRSMTNPPIRRTSSRASTPTPSSSAVSRTSATRTTSRSTTPRTSSRSTVSRPTTTRTTSQRSITPTPSRTKAYKPTTTQTTVHRPRTSGSSDFEKLKPKAGILSLEDFKCIFCFQLPKIPADNSRGIVLCPNCRHPAHADEFKEWTQDSPLCSRCDGSIPLSFRRNPVIIPVNQYIEVIEEFKRRKT
jgi:hypothetical protein